MNFKMGICRFSSLNPLKIKKVKLNSSLHKKKFDFLLKEHTSFLKWFSGFTDAEGNFLISIDRDYIRFRFKIAMHIDNLDALNTIKSILNVGNVTIDKNRNCCSYVVQDFTEIRDVICPIF
jgi:hypothetical protein